MESKTILVVGALGVGAYLIYRNLAPATATAAPAAGSTSAPAAPAQPAFNSLDQIYGRLSAAVKAANDPAITGGDTATFDVFNFYLGTVSDLTGLPSSTDVFGTPTTVPMTVATYWAALAPWLKANKGLSGLGVFAGLGALASQAALRRRE